MKYAAFLRGINVGGVTVKMAELKTMLEKAGFENVKTLLASGNVLFDAKVTDTDALEKKVENLLKKRYNRDIAVMVRTLPELEKLNARKPFKDVKTTPNTFFYVAFLSENSRGVNIPKDDSHLRIVQIMNKDVLFILEHAPERKTTDAMKILGQIFGPRITTRNWNTVQKVLKASSI